MGDRNRVAAHPGVAPLIMAFADFLTLEAAVGLGVWGRGALNVWAPIGIGAEIYQGAMVAVAFILVGYRLAGLYPGYGLTSVERFRLRVIVTALGFGGLTLFDYIAQNGQWSRGILLISAAFALFLIPVCDVAVRRGLAVLGVWGTPVAVFGAPEHRRTVVERLRRRPDIGWVPVFEAEKPTAVAQASLAVVASSSLEAVGGDEMDHLPYSGVVVVLCGAADRQNLWVSARDVGACLGLEMRRNLLVGVNKAVKRGLDLVLVVAFGPLAAVVVGLLAVLVKIASPGSAFFLQWREGRDGEPFRIVKLRTMRVGADAELPNVLRDSAGAADQWRRGMKLPGDPRIIPGLGRFMRRFSLDELPQLLNVLKGEMSLVGPRPLPAYHIAALDPASCRLRRLVRPGVTGLWQVSGRSSTTLDEQQALDSYYVRNWSIWLDLHILAQSAVIVLTGRDAW